MTSYRSTAISVKPLHNPAPSAGGPIRAWVRFWFTPIDPIGLHVLRIGAGLLFLAWLLPMAGHVNALFGTQGWFDLQAYADAADRVKLPDGPPKPIGWSLLYLATAHPNLVTPVYWTSVAVVVLFILGLFTRLTSVLTWVVVCSFTASPVIDMDADPLLSILAFYLMIGYVFLGQGQKGLSPHARLLGPWSLRRRADSEMEGSPPSTAANLALRLLQVHLTIVLVTSGLHKLQFGDWWAGVAFWFPLFPPFETTLEQVRSHRTDADLFLGFLSLAAYATLAWQIGFPLFAWRARWRPIMLGGAALGWIGAAFLYRLPLVGPALFIACLSFVSPAEWHWVLGLLTRIPGLNRAAHWLLALPDEREVPTLSEQPASLVTVGQR